MNATINDRRKGKEHLAHQTLNHPSRPAAVSNPDSAHHPWPHHPLPVKVMKKEIKQDPVSELERMKSELLAMMRQADKKPRSVPKSKLIGMAMESAKEEPTKDYSDVLAMLLAKK